MMDDGRHHISGAVGFLTGASVSAQRYFTIIVRCYVVHRNSCVLRIGLNHTVSVLSFQAVWGTNSIRFAYSVGRFHVALTDDSSLLSGENVDNFAPGYVDNFFCAW
jgi:hypothetical protein